MGGGAALELLEQLTACVGCDYLSDLRFSTASSRTETALAGIPDDAYSLAEWNRAVDYIVGRQPAPSISVAQAKERLLAFWSRATGAKGSL